MKENLFYGAVVLSSLIFATLPLLGNEAPKKEASGHGEEKPAHAEGKTEAKPDPHGGGHSEAAAPEAAKPIGRSRKYNPGPVEPFPSPISAANVLSGRTFNYSVERGRVALVIFLASWCEPCQLMVSPLKEIASRYQDKYTDPIFVFSHDTKDDAKGFATEHKITGNVIAANHDILRGFKNPPLPAVYVSDRYTFMGRRFLKISKNDLKDLDDYLSKVTAL